MGCTTSKLQEEEVVSFCRERKQLLKTAVERRYALAEAHSKYICSLQTIATSVHHFATQHSSPSPFLITLPPPPPSSSSPPSFSDSSLSAPLQKNPPPSTIERQEGFLHRPSICTSSSSSSVSSPFCSSPVAVSPTVEENPYFFTHNAPATPPPPSPPRGFTWDFFNPFFEGVRNHEGERQGRLSRSEDEDLRVVRQEEGIPELEDEEERREEEEEEEEEEERKVVVVGTEKEQRNEVEAVKVVVGSVSGKEQRGLTVIDTPARERDLLDALKDIEDHFIRAYDSGKEVSRMLEANRVHLQSGLDEIKENSSKLIHAITWHRSTSSSQSSSYKSYLASSSKDTSWADSKNDLFDGCGGMLSGSHTQTLGSLYAWEKKLYEEVKAGDRTRRIYERKCSQLRNLDAKGDDSHTVDKTRAAVKDLYTRIWVAIRAAESISARIQRLRDDELLPQLTELLKGLMRCWKIMLESHETQNQIMFEVKSFTCSASGKFCTESHRQATLQLEGAVQNWRASFNGWIGAQRAYVEAMDGWLTKFIIPEVEFCSRKRSQIPLYRAGVPPLLVICREWSTSLRKLPDRAVSQAIRSFGRDVKALWLHQGEEQQQKRKVDNIAKELDKRVLAFQRAENKLMESKLSELGSEPDLKQRVNYLAGRKDLLDMFRKRLEVERGKHHKCMQETHQVTLNGFQTGFASIFESLTEFSKASLKMYDELLVYSEEATNEKEGKPSCIEGSQVDVDSG